MNAKYRFMSALFSTLALGCHSVPLRSPAEANPTYVKDYQEARMLSATAPDRACELFTKLSIDQKFAARDLARLRSREVCPSTAAVELGNLPEYLKDIGLDIALNLAAKAGDKSTEMELALEKSKQKLSQNEKLKWNELALKRARELKMDARAEDITKRQYVIAPRLNPNPPEALWLAVANDLRLSRKFHQSREYYEKVLRSNHFKLDDKISAFKGMRLTYKNARQHDEHLVVSQRMVDYLSRAKFPDALMEAELYHARAIWTLGDGAKAKQNLLRIEKRLKGRASLAELYWLLGRIAEEQNNPAEVSQYLNAALNEPSKDKDLRDKVLWYSAWNERRQKNYARAAEVLEQLQTETEGDFTRVRAQFWLGKTYSDMNKTNEAGQVLRDLIDADPTGYYGLLASRHLNLPISFKRPANPPSDDPRIPLDQRLADWLIALDEPEALSKLLTQSALNYRKQKDQTAAGWITLFKFFAKGGLYAKLYETMGQVTSEMRKNIVEGQPELLFPQPFYEAVQAAAANYKVDEQLIYAIMRQESAFDPKARSGADAFGLMQVLPEIAEDIAFKQKITYLHMDDLYDPRVNVPIGALHIRDLLKRHKNQFILAVASYNASEKAIANWMKTRFRGDALEFIEEIPYEETRVYVRLVMRNWIFYSLLKSRSASIQFPAWVLKLDAN